MLKKRLVKNQTKPADIVSKVYLYSGVVILISALFYMIGNLQKADAVVSVWLPIMASGTVLVFMSIIVKTLSTKKYHKSTTDAK